MEFAKWNVQNSSFLSWCWFSFLKWNLKRGKVQLLFFEHCFSWCAKYTSSPLILLFFGPRFDRPAASQQQLHFWPQKPHAFLASQNAEVKNFAQTGQKSDGLCPPYSYTIFFRKPAAKKMYDKSSHISSPVFVFIPRGRVISIHMLKLFFNK